MYSKYFFYLFLFACSFIAIQISYNVVGGQIIDNQSEVNTNTTNTNTTANYPTNLTNISIEFLGTNNILESANEYEKIQILHPGLPETTKDMEAFEDKNISKFTESIENKVFYPERMNDVNSLYAIKPSFSGKIITFNAKDVLGPSLTQNSTLSDSTQNFENNSNNGNINQSEIPKFQDTIKTHNIVKKWEGLNYKTAAPPTDKAADNTEGPVPPDVALAVGPDHVVQMVHSAVTMWDKNGNEIKTLFLTDFFNTKEHYELTDPVVLYDNATEKWFSVIIEFSPKYNSKGKEIESCTSNCSLQVAVSTDKDPTMPWNIYGIPFDKQFPDYPMIGVSKDKFAIGVNIFPNKKDYSLGIQTIVIDKKDLVNNKDFYKYKSPIYTDSDYDTPVPVTSDTGCLYMEAINWKSSKKINKMVLLETCGKPSTKNNFKFNTKEINMQSIGCPEYAIQPNKIRHEAGSCVIQSPVYFNNTVLSAVTYGCDHGRDSKTCISLLKLNVNESEPFVDSVGISEEENHYLFYPALSVDKDGNIVMIYGISSSETYPSLLTMILDKDFNMVQNTLLVKGDGNSNNQTNDKKEEEKRTAERFGDYFTAVTDPIDGSVWITGEYGNKTIENAWSTYVGNVS